MTTMSGGNCGVSGGESAGVNGGGSAGGSGGVSEIGIQMLLFVVSGSAGSSGEGSMRAQFCRSGGASVGISMVSDNVSVADGSRLTCEASQFTSTPFCSQLHGGEAATAMRPNGSTSVMRGVPV